MYIHERAVHTNTYTQPPRRRPSRRTRTTRSLALRAPLAGSRPRRSPRRRPRRSVRRRRRETAARTRGSPSARRAAWDRKPGTGGTGCRRRWPLRPGIQCRSYSRDKRESTPYFVYEKFTQYFTSRLTRGKHGRHARRDPSGKRYARFRPHLSRVAAGRTCPRELDGSRGLEKALGAASSAAPLRRGRRTAHVQARCALVDGLRADGGDAHHGCSRM